VKELVENAVDAGATRVEVRLKGADIDVIDDGRGIPQSERDMVAKAHATSKIARFEDIHSSLSTLGFRGEAVSALCALADLTITTRTAEDDVARIWEFDKLGDVKKEDVAARGLGTTVQVRNLFGQLPVRHRELHASLKNQVHQTLAMLQQYAIVEHKVRFNLVGERQGKPSALLSSSGQSSDMRQAASTVLGPLQSTVPITLSADDEIGQWELSGWLSSPLGGRRSKDWQFFFFNRRPVDLPKKLMRVVNDVYREFNSLRAPVVIFHLTAPLSAVDVNVTPDKRTVLLQQAFEARLSATLEGVVRTALAPAAAPSVTQPISNFLAFRPIDPKAEGVELRNAKRPEPESGSARKRPRGEADDETVHPPQAPQAPIVLDDEGASPSVGDAAPTPPSDAEDHAADARRASAVPAEPRSAGRAAALAIPSISIERSAAP
jgi:DNA mismatch repair protein PMS2